MNKTTSIIIAVLILGGAFYFTSRDSTPTSSPTESTQKVSNVPVENSVIKDGVQYITITARSGYSPRMSTAKAGIPTKLIMKTNGTYDCSSSLVIRSLNYRNILPNTGETTIDAGTLKAGDTLQGVCGMGMYSFLVTFS
jgi:plastocyanin domain-containing protein